MIQAVIKSFRPSINKKIEENSNDAFRYGLNKYTTYGK